MLSKPNIVKRKQVEHTNTERRVLGTINHPFIVKLHYAFQTNDKLYFVLDYAAGGELFYHLSRMKKFPEHMSRFYTAEMTMALDELHKHVRCSTVPILYSALVMKFVRRTLFIEISSLRIFYWMQLVILSWQILGLLRRA